MKIKKFLAMMLIAACAAFAVACDDDDDDVTVDTSLGADIAGTYTGYTSSTFAYISYYATYEGESVVIEDAGNSKVNVTLTSGNWGTFTISGAAVTLSGSTYTIDESAGTATMTGHSSTSTYDFTMSGSVASGNVSLSVSVPDLMKGTTIFFETGEAPAAALVSGSYSGNMSLTVAGTDCGTVATTVLLVADDDDNTTLTLGGFSLAVAGMGSSITLGDIAIPSVTVAEASDGSYTLTSDSFEISDVNYGEDNTITVTGSLSGTIGTDKVLTINFSLTPGSMPMAITAVFSTSEDVVPAANAE